MLQSLVVPALPTLQTDLDTTPTGVTWIFTAYLLAASVATPIAGRLGDMFGKKRTLVVVLAGLGAGTLLAALATSLPVMIGARTIQGLGGAIFPLAFGIVRDEFPRERVAGGIALISGLLGVGAGLGIILAGPDSRTPRLPLAVLDPAAGDRAHDHCDDRDRARVAGSSPRHRQLAGRHPALPLAHLPAARDQRGARPGDGSHRARSACSRGQPCSRSSGSGPRAARPARSST